MTRKQEPVPGMFISVLVFLGAVWVFLLDPTHDTGRAPILLVPLGGSALWFFLALEEYRSWTDLECPRSGEVHSYLNYGPADSCRCKCKDVYLQRDPMKLVDYSCVYRP